MCVDCNFLLQFWPFTQFQVSPITLKSKINERLVACFIQKMAAVVCLHSQLFKITKSTVTYSPDNKCI